MWKKGETPSEGTEAHNQPMFAVDFANLSGAGRSLSSSLVRWCGWGVSVGDVKLLFGHLSDRGPHRLPVSARVFEVTGHDAGFRRKRPQFVLFSRQRPFYASFVLFNVSTCNSTPMIWWLRLQCSALHGPS